MAPTRSTPYARRVAWSDNSVQELLRYFVALAWALTPMLFDLPLWLALLLIGFAALVLPVGLSIAALLLTNRFWPDGPEWVPLLLTAVLPSPILLLLLV